MKKRLIMLGTFALSLFLSMFITSLLINRGNVDMTREMEAAVLPVVYIMEENEYVNLHFGYTGEMSGNLLRGTLSPLAEGRILPIMIETFGTAVSRIGYEIRSMDMERLVEDQVLSEYSTEGSRITADIGVKDLITPEVEYMLILKLTLSDDTLARYYIRFINKEGLNTGKKLSFVKDFSEKTFDKSAVSELKVYMEPNSEGDNSSFGYVNIHSSIEQLTWGGLSPRLSGERQLHIYELDSINASIGLKYQVTVSDELYNVSEYFRIREGQERMYLMEYERTMDQIITNEEELLVNGKLLHGILSRSLERIENENGSVYAFVQENTLYSYNTDNGNLSRIFSFRNGENDDVRTDNPSHEICPVRIDEQGNILFTVYGYFNRGSHEGEEGIAVYYYDAVINSIEEQLFIDHDGSFELLKHDMELLCRINMRDSMYIYLDGTIYRINIDTTDMNEIVAGLNESIFAASGDGSMIAWGDEAGYSSITLMNLDNELMKTIEAGSAELLFPLGFMGKDLIYGKARISDACDDGSGGIVYPMYEICIVDPSGRTLREHIRAGYYFMGIEINDNIINISRCIKDDAGRLVETDSEQILTNEKTEAEINVYTSVVTENMETTWQTVLKRGEPDRNIKVLTPTEGMYEGERRVEPGPGTEQDRLYVYSKGEIAGVYTDEATAVMKAGESFACVVDRSCSYIYEAGNRKERVLLEELSGPQEHEEGADSLYVCMSALLKYEGVYEDMDALMKRVNESGPVNALSEVLVDRHVLNLKGCSLRSVLYYVSQGHPVLALAEDSEPVMIIGYDSKNVIIYDAAADEVRKNGMNDSTAWFDANGNRFISYVDHAF